MYTIENYDNLEKGTINRSECAKRTILSNFKTIDKDTLARLCSAINYSLYEFVIYGQKINNITLVGDYYQHSVSGQNNSGKPFKKGKNEVSYDEFLENLKKEKFDVDHISFGSSRRCPEAVCNFVNEKLKINIIADFI